MRIRIAFGVVRGLWFTDVGQRVEQHIPEGWYKLSYMGQNVTLTDGKGKQFITSAHNMREAGYKV